MFWLLLIKINCRSLQTKFTSGKLSQIMNTNLLEKSQWTFQWSFFVGNFELIKPLKSIFSSWLVQFLDNRFRQTQLPRKHCTKFRCSLHNFFAYQSDDSRGSARTHRNTWNLYPWENAIDRAKAQLRLWESISNLFLRQKIPGIKPLGAHGTIYLTLELTLEHFKDIKSDKEFVKLLFEEENVSILPLSVFGTGLQGMRLMTCALEPYYDQFFVRL